MQRPEHIINNKLDDVGGMVLGDNLESNSMDNLFKPMSSQIESDNSSFNSYKVSRGSDIKTKLNEIQQMRTNEIPSLARPTTPEFLKSEKVGKDNSNNNHFQDNSNNNHFQNNSEYKGNGVPDFSKPVNNVYNGMLSGNNQSGSFINGQEFDGNLFSIDNIDAPPPKLDMKEDSASFEDRLKRLQRDKIKQ